jgi:large subunit ribosomal protein L21e
MVQRSRGTLSSNTRKLRGKTKVTVADEVRTFEIGSKVILKLKARHRGRPHLRYSGRHGHIIKKQGNAYVVKVKDGKSTKELIASPIHLMLA